VSELLDFDLSTIQPDGRAALALRLAERYEVDQDVVELALEGPVPAAAA
jgi:hypothetical protein